MLGDFVLVEHAADSNADLARSCEVAALDPRAHLIELAARGLEQRGALVRPRPPQLRVATGHQALARIIRVGELEQVALVKQPQLQRLALHQSTNLAALERRDPGQPRVLAQRLHHRAADHAPIAHENYLARMDKQVELPGVKSLTGHHIAHGTVDCDASDEGRRGERVYFASRRCGT